MAIFIEAVDGKIYPSSLIVEIGKSYTADITQGSYRYQATLHPVELSTGLVIAVQDHRIEELLRSPLSAFAAAPGTYVVSMDDMDPIKWPVIGWSISSDGGVYPVTMNGVNEGLSNSTHVLLPTGDVTAYDQTWETLDRWREEQVFGAQFAETTKKST